MAPPRSSSLAWQALSDVSSKILTTVIFSHRVLQGLDEAENCSRIEKLVGETLQAAATNILENAVTDQDLRVKSTFVAKSKDSQPIAVRLTVNLLTEAAVKLLDAIPKVGNQIATPDGDMLHLKWPDRPITEAFLITNVPSGIKVDSIQEHMKEKWDLETLSLGYAPTRGSPGLFHAHTLLGVFKGTKFPAQIVISGMPGAPGTRKMSFRRITLPPPPPPSPPPRPEAGNTTHLNTATLAPTLAAVVAQGKFRKLSTAEKAVLNYLVNSDTASRYHAADTEAAAATATATVAAAQGGTAAVLTEEAGKAGNQANTGQARIDANEDDIQSMGEGRQPPGATEEQMAAERNQGESGDGGQENNPNGQVNDQRDESERESGVTTEPEDSETADEIVTGDKEGQREALSPTARGAADVAGVSAAVAGNVAYGEQEEVDIVEDFQVVQKQKQRHTEASDRRLQLLTRVQSTEKVSPSTKRARMAARCRDSPPTKKYGTRSQPQATVGVTYPTHTLSSLPGSITVQNTPTNNSFALLEEEMEIDPTIPELDYEASPAPEGADGPSDKQQE
ncbi:hypothetical protein Ndes2526B_g03982 [Nannochloris sp. 'desiccata']